LSIDLQKQNFMIAKFKKIITNFLAILSALVFCFLLTVLSIIMYFNAPNSYHKKDKVFVIENGLTFREVTYKLYNEKIIKHPIVFLYLSQVIKGYSPKVHYGEYFFEKNISYYKMLHKMVKGYNFFRKITIPEGLSLDSALKIINKTPGLIGKLPEDLKIKEGSLLPETYFYSYNDSKLATLRRMTDAMTKNLDELWKERDLNTIVKTKEQALILASIIERETNNEMERPKIASVFTNRLRKNIKLQSDPTVIYSFTMGNKNLERKIRQSDLRNSSPFNTYNIYGLPPAPICNPGLASIKAVLHPIQTDYIYFVAAGKNEHHFSVDIKEHNLYVTKYRQSLKAKNEIPLAAPTIIIQNNNAAISI
jgi:UPF0755 protein